MSRSGPEGARAAQTPAEEITICLTCQLSRCQPNARACPLKHTPKAIARSAANVVRWRKRNRSKSAARNA